MKERPKVGLGIIVVREGKILFGKRKNQTSFGTWCAPGGHLESGEALEECAKREVREETGGIEINNICFAAVTNDIFDYGHYITIHMKADYVSGEARETDSSKEWDWFEWDKLPESLFLSSQNLVDGGYDPFK